MHIRARDNAERTSAVEVAIKGYCKSKRNEGKNFLDCPSQKLYLHGIQCVYNTKILVLKSNRRYKVIV